MLRKEGHSVRQDIKNAALRLMTEKSYLQITVTDMINTAQVARASFYRNFGSINDVLDAIVDDLSAELVEDVYPVLASTDERVWREFLFHHFYRFSRKSLRMGELLPQNVSVLFARMDRSMQRREQPLPAQTLRQKYQAAAKLGLINNVTKKWMDHGMTETPEELVDYLMSFILLF